MIIQQFLRLTSILLIVPTLLEAETTNWAYHDDGSEGTGSAVKSFECEVQKEDEKVTLVMISSWTPGATIEIRGAANSADIQSITAGDGSSGRQILFTFQDSYGNRGVGKFTTWLNGSELELTVTKEHPDLERSRVARQYRDIPIPLKPAS